jgi:hypothetical protein
MVNENSLSDEADLGNLLGVGGREFALAPIETVFLASRV